MSVEDDEASTAGAESVQDLLRATVDEMAAAYEVWRLYGLSTSATGMIQ